jgi:hypothetical protein
MYFPVQILTPCDLKRMVNLKHVNLQFDWKTAKSIFAENPCWDEFELRRALTDMPLALKIPFLEILNRRRLAPSVSVDFLDVCFNECRLEVLHRGLLKQSS